MKNLTIALLLLLTFSACKKDVKSKLLGTHEVIVSGNDLPDDAKATLTVSTSENEYLFSVSGSDIGPDFNFKNKGPVNDRRLTKQSIQIQECSAYCIQGDKNLLEGQVNMDTNKISIYLNLRDSTMESNQHFTWFINEQ